jgi:hypothetical protein
MFDYLLGELMFFKGQIPEFGKSSLIVVNRLKRKKKKLNKSSKQIQKKITKNFKENSNENKKKNKIT